MVGIGVGVLEGINLIMFGLIISLATVGDGLTVGLGLGVEVGVEVLEGFAVGKTEGLASGVDGVSEGRTAIVGVIETTDVEFGVLVDLPMV